MIYRLLRTQLHKHVRSQYCADLEPFFEGCESTTSTCRSRSAALQPAESIDATHNEKHERGRTPVRIEERFPLRIAKTVSHVDARAFTHPFPSQVTRVDSVG